MLFFVTEKQSTWFSSNRHSIVSLNEALVLAFDELKAISRQFAHDSVVFRRKQNRSVALLMQRREFGVK